MFSKILLIFAIYYAAQIISGEKLKVTIYYESECRYSKEFFQMQIAPSYQFFRDKVVFVFVPFGKSYRVSTSDGSIDFTCQHGPIECYGNVWELCALDMIGPNQDIQAAFVFCDMSENRVREECTTNAGLNVLDVQHCVETRGHILELQAENVTAPVIAKSGKVPTIEYNGTYEESEYFGAYNNFTEFTIYKLSTMNQ